MIPLQRNILKYLKERKWDNLRPADLAKSISIEAAELLELFQWSGEELAEVLRDKEKIKAVEKELADVFIYAFEMAALLGLDAEKLVKKKLAKIKKKYPARLMRKIQSREPGRDSLYLKIKQSYRRRGLS